MARDFPLLKPSSDSQPNCIHSRFIIRICCCAKVVPLPKKLLLVFSAAPMSVDSYYISPQPLFCQAERTRLLQPFLPEHAPRYRVLRLLCPGSALHAEVPAQETASPGRQRHRQWLGSAGGALSDGHQNCKGFFAMVSHWQLTGSTPGSFSWVNPSR